MFSDCQRLLSGLPTDNLKDLWDFSSSGFIRL
jgi:hypothetical protein